MSRESLDDLAANKQHMKYLTGAYRKDGFAALHAYKRRLAFGFVGACLGVLGMVEASSARSVSRGADEVIISLAMLSGAETLDQHSKRQDARERILTSAKAAGRLMDPLIQFEAVVPEEQWVYSILPEEEVNAIQNNIAFCNRLAQLATADNMFNDQV